MLQDPAQFSTACSALLGFHQEKTNHLSIFLCNSAIYSLKRRFVCKTSELFSVEQRGKNDKMIIEQFLATYLPKGSTILLLIFFFNIKYVII